MQDLGDRLQGKALHDVLGPPCTESLLAIEQIVTNAMKNILSRLKETQDYSASFGPGNGEMSATLERLGELTKVSIDKHANLFLGAGLNFTINFTV